MDRRTGLSLVKVLLVDDDEDEYVIIKAMLDKIPDMRFELDWCASFVEAKKVIAQTKHDAYLVDYRLGGHTGLELLEFAKPQRRNQPFILLTGVGDRDIAWKSMKLAAADYLVKGSFNEELLGRILSYAIERKQIEQQRLDHLLELNKSKDEFISIASHQLRTPATGVKQYLGMLLEGYFGELTPKQKQMLEKAYHNNDRQLRIVSDLLKVAQVDAGKINLHRAEVELDKLVKSVVDDHSGRFASRGQKLIFKPKPEGERAMIDEEAVRMVLDNLLDNASKYSPEKTTTTVSVKRSGGMACIDVKDQGVGISEDSRSRLFQKFSRIDNPRSREESGTGLGLYWAKKIIDEHKGEIKVTSEEGNGSRFTVCLPKA
ncbi:MAG TPA: ATP-binding protein [Candidatus Saccharimonadales bacterium]|nr:ATP-binding protein [Candidatus Saccharimonadales bacterium]